MNEIESEYSGVVREILVAGRAAGRVRAGALQDRSQWLIPRSRTGDPRAAPPTARRRHQLQGGPAGDGPAQRLRPSSEGRPSADASRRRRARRRSSMPPLRPEDLKALAEQLDDAAAGQAVRRREGVRLRDRRAGHRPLPRQRVSAARLALLRDARHSVSGADDRRAESAARCSRRSRCSRAGSCSSPA